MMPALELCAHLGYHNGENGSPARGLAKELLDDMKAYVAARQWLKDPFSMSTVYLEVGMAGYMFWPKAESVQGRQASSDQHLEWPVDSGR